MGVFWRVYCVFCGLTAERDSLYKVVASLRQQYRLSWPSYGLDAEISVKVKPQVVCKRVPIKELETFAENGLIERVLEEVDSRGSRKRYSRWFCYQ